MPATTNNDEENTFEVQAGARRPGGRGRGSRGARQQSAHPSERGAPDNADASSSGAWSSGEEEEEEEEDLFPDVTLPEPDDVVRIRQSFVSHYVPVFLEGTPQWLQQHPIFQTTEPRLGVVCPEDDPALDGRLDDEVHEGLVPVRFYCVDDRASAMPFRRIEMVPEEAVEVLFRPFTASEVVVAEGDTGVIDDVELELYVKPVPFPASLAAFAPPQLRERLTIATMKDYTSLADLFESDGSGGDRKKSHGRSEHHFDPSSVGAPSMADDAEMPSAGGAGRGKRGAKGKFKASKKVVTERELKMRKRVLAAARDPNRQSFEDFVDSCTKVPTAQFAPLSPFRPEVCVVHRHSQLVGMVVEVIEATLVAFDCGVVAVTTDFAGWNTAMSTELSHENRQSAFFAPGQRCRFESIEGCGTIIGSFDPEHEGCWEGTAITALPYIVRCAFTTDAGVTWDDGGVDCHPADLFPLDLYYPEFVTVFTPGIVVDPAFRRDVIGAAMEEGVRSAVERGEVTLPSHTTADDLVDALKSHREEREDALKARRAAAAARPGENVEEVEQHLLQLNAAAALEEEIEKAATTYDGNGPPPLSKDGLAKVLEHTCRSSAADGAAICGSLSTLEYATLYRMLQPPARLPPSASDTASNATDEAAECRGQWQALLQGIMRFLPNMATVRFAASKVTVAWNSGRMDYAKDSREVLLRMEAPESEAAPPPEVLRLVAPAGARRYTFPIEFKDPVTERVGEYDLADLPAQHHAAMPGDVVMLKCKDDFDRDASYPAESQHEPSRIIGRVLESQERDRVCVVHWAPSALEQDVTDRDTFPSFSVPPQDPATCERIQLASRALEPLTGRLLVGGVVRMLNDGRAVIRWWDDTVETLPAQMLQVVEFQELSSITGGEGEEEEEEDGEADDERVETAGATGPEDASQTAAPPQSGVAGLLTNVVRRAAEAVSTMVKNTRGKAEEAEDDDDASSHGSSAADVAPGGDADDGAATGTGENTASGTEEAHAAAAAAPAANNEGATQAASADVGSFDVVPHFTSHLLQPEDAFSPAEPKRFYKRLQTEWRKLQKEVPPGVMVKVSEEEMHLMKLLIRGPVHTPYYQGAYAFDVFFPPEFPAKPPTVKHHAYRIRMNPNLYENGYVCLSLLGTWEGRDACEEWNPVNSSVLQLVHALQAMVLNKEPYFNEPGFEEGKGTERARSASRFANEAYYLLKLEHMAKMAHSPPPDWAFEVRRHVTEYAPRLFARADSYVALGSQAPAGAAEGSINSDGLVLPLTRGFHVSLSRQLAALRENVGKLIAQWEKDATAFTDVDDGTSSPR